MNINTLKLGDLIVRAKGPFSTHFMVYLGVKNGYHMVAENQNGYGVRIVDIATALAGNSIKRLEPFGGTEVQRSLVIPKINQLIGRGYDLIAFNCEHFARWIATGKLESKQVKTASTVAIISGAALLTSQNPAIKVLGGVSIIAGIFGHASQGK